MVKRSFQAQLARYRGKLLRYNRLIYTSTLLTLVSPVAYAVNTEFTGAVDNDWSNIANWTTGVPIETDIAVVDSIIVSDTDVNLASKLLIGYETVGNLTINNGTFTTNNYTIELGSSTIASGTINITDNGSFVNNGNVDIGRGSTGNMLLNGGSISGKNFRLGTRSSGTGIFDIQSGTATLSNELRVGSSGGANAKLSIDDGSLTVKNLIFGYQGISSTSLVMNGGIITAEKLALGRSASASVTIELKGGVLQADSLGHVGGNGIEKVNITSGILRLQQANRSAFDTLHANGSLDWAPGKLLADYDPSTADEIINNENGALYIRNDEDGYFSVWSTTPNNNPVFTESPILLPYVESGQSFSATLANKVIDADEDDLLTFSIVSGPSWLNVAADNTISGTPTRTDAGANNFTIAVNDGNTTVTNLMKIWVAADIPLVVDDFNSGFGNWLNGGANAHIAQDNCISGECLNIQSSGDSSSVTLIDALNLTDYDDVNLNFSLLPKGFNTAEGFSLLYSSDGGNSWLTVKSFIKDIDFTDNIRQTIALAFSKEQLAFTNHALFRFEGNGSGTSDAVYIDDLTISAKAYLDRNNAPEFNSDTLTGNDAIDSVNYNGSLSNLVTDVDGDTLTFSKINGPDWLVVAADGSLIGTPTTADIGTNTFIVQVNDGKGGLSSVNLVIEVYATTGGGFILRTFDDFSDGYGNWLDGGKHAKRTKSRNKCVESYCVNFQAKGEESTITLAEGLDLTDYNSLKVGFSFKTYGMKKTEGFLIEYSIDGGQNWAVIKKLVQGIDFINTIETNLDYIFTNDEFEFSDNTLIRFQGNGYGSGHDVFIDNIATSVAFINYLPIFSNDPINADHAAKNWDYTGSIAHLVTDKNGDSLNFTKVNGPAWLTVADDGTLSGRPELSDVGNNVFTVQANDGAGGITQATLNIPVDLSMAPSFNTEQLSKDNAVENTTYHASIANDASDLDGDPLNFAKLSGPRWLTVATDGSLSGQPSADDIGINTFTFVVNDGFGGTGSATLTIYVGAASGGYPQYRKTPTADEWALSFALADTDKDAEANPDGDHLDNFHEYAFGGDPTKRHNEQVVKEIEIIGNSFTVSHTRLRNAKSLGIDYQFQAAKNMDDPLWLDITPDDIKVELLSTAYELVTYSGQLPFMYDADNFEDDNRHGQLIVTRSGPFANQESKRINAELVLSDHITTKSGNIYEDWFGYAAPQGIVDNNSPWMHVRIPFPGDPSWPIDRGTRLYHYKLSQDPTLTSNLITETPKRWSFFNPLTKLAPGTWYWTAGHSTVTDPENIEWLGETYQFNISGTEEQYIPPSADKVWEISQKKASPKMLMRENDFGSLLDIQDETSNAVIAQADRLIRKGIVYVDDKGNTKASSDTIAQLVLAYGASGNTAYRDAALAGFPYVPTQPTDTEMEAAKEADENLKCLGSGFGIRRYVGMGVAFLDIMPDELPEQMETDLVANMLQYAKCTPEGWISTMIDRYEHVNYESHVVQKVIHTLIFGGLAIGDRHPEGKEMFKYAYELWLYKGPHGGRSDGSWHNGFGYMSVNEDQLMATPWILGELTGFDYMMHPWYRNNAKAMSYLRSYGNPGQYYGDKASDGYGYTTGGPAMQISGGHLYTHPDNRWMLWQTHTNLVDPLLNKVKKMADQWQRWLLLPMRKHFTAPDYSNVVTPLATAEAYRDVGYVAAHSNIEDATTNFMTTMRSSPFSSSHKSHASQNAFTTAYGGLPLFYRTGWRKKGEMVDYTNSKAFNLIMPNGVSQKRRDKSAYAFLPRFAHGDRMSYWIGDASNTYPEATGVNRFRRHMVHLKPNILVIYDEVDSTEAATTWTYTLNAHNEIKTLDDNDNIISVHNTLGLATANLFTSSPLKTVVTGPTLKHWNSRITTTEQSASVRFLNVIELTPSTDINEVVAALPATGTDLITVDASDYEVIAQLDANQPAHLEVRSSDGNVALLYGEGINSLTVDGATVLSGRYKASTLFMEKNTPRGDIIEELVDELPDSITYSNKY